MKNPHAINVNVINDNDNFSKKNNNVINDNVNDMKTKRIDNLAYSIALAINNLDNPIARKLYCKAAWHLPEATIWNSVELAKNKGKNPIKYLSYLLNMELGKGAGVHN